jgi:phospholipase A1
MIRHLLLLACFLLAWLCGAQWSAADTIEDYDACYKLKKEDRLKCYDDIAERRQKASAASPAPISATAARPEIQTVTVTKSEAPSTTPTAADAAGDLAGCIAGCKGEKEKCDAERLRCYDDKAKYSWSMCMFGSPAWIKESPGSLNACKYFFEDTERLYGFDKITGFETITPEERYKPSFLSIKWRLNEVSRQLNEKRRMERFVKKREELDQESRQLDRKISQIRRELDEKSGRLNEEKRHQLDEESRRALDEKSRIEMKIRQINEENSRALEEENRLGRLALAYRQNYILFGTYNFHPDAKLWESANPGKELEDYEAKFQLSLKLKLFDITDNSVTGDWERHLGMHIDVWLAYTQLSFWQIYNASISRPFRETNYEPELILNGRMDKDLFYEWKLRFIQLALNHQSNGQSDPLSRSWNRLLFNFGFERENFDVVLRTWYRFPEGENDDNPDIESYLGYGELSAGYRRNLCGIDWRFSLMFRNNLRFDDENRSALQLGVEANLFGGPLNLYVQYFTGYGESLINYNSYANTIGAGVSVKDW